jgi:hypothetical protein
MLNSVLSYLVTAIDRFNVPNLNVSYSLTTTVETCSDWAEIISLASLKYFKIMMFLHCFFFLSRIVSKFFALLYFSFLKIYYRALFSKMFQQNFFYINLMSCELIAVKSVQISLMLIEICIV